MPMTRSITESNTSRARSLYGQARRTVSYHSSTSRSSTATAATVCCASTSRGLRGVCSSSMRPSRIRGTVTAVCTRSERCFG